MTRGHRIKTRCDYRQQEKDGQIRYEDRQDLGSFRPY